MEIPYIVTPRKDTGLFNSKIAIWLFLASEVMLFGGFFSGYVFMRLGADYPWPERTLPILPGLINTFVLIASSVTVVFAWASLKLRQWRRFQLFMGLTVGCAVLFMGLKAVEYNVKFHHQAVRLKDYTIIEGHLGYEKNKDGSLVEDRNGDHVEHNKVHIKAESIDFSVVRYHKPWVEEIIHQAHEHGAKLVLAADLKADDKRSDKETVYAEAGTELSLELLAKLKEQHLDARGHNADLRTDALRDAWEKAHEDNPGKRDWQISDKVNINEEALAPRSMTEMATISFKVDPPVVFDFTPRDIKEDKGQSRLKDDTVINGTLLVSPMGFHHVDAIDFQYLAMQAEKKGVDPLVAIESSWVIQNWPFAREAWEWHRQEVAKKEKELLARYGVDEAGHPVRVPTFKERYRIGWKDLRDKAESEGKPKLGFLKGTIGEEFKGPNYDLRGDETFPELEVPRKQIAFESKFTPSWNTYYAIYFTITGLHGLHVIGGALVLAYYLFFTRRMYETNPEWLANRVEVGGLFWHFVDLIWIFAFPIFYLM